MILELTCEERQVIQRAFEQAQENAYHWGGDGIMLSDEQRILSKVEAGAPCSFSVREIRLVMDWMRPKESANAEEKNLAAKIYRALLTEIRPLITGLRETSEAALAEQELLEAFPHFDETSNEGRMQNTLNEIYRAIKPLQYYLLQYETNTTAPKGE